MEGTTCSKSKLILHVIEDHFGNIVKEVASYMINYEDCTISNIYRHYSVKSKDKRLSYSQIKDSLLILLHNNCLNVEISPLLDDEIEVSSDNKLNQKDLIYSLNYEMVLNRLRFPQLLLITKKLFGDIGVAIIEEIILNSRVTMNNVINTVKIKIQDSNSIESEESCENKIQQTFLDLIQKRLLIAVQYLHIQRRTKVANSKAISMFTNITDKKTSNSLNNTSYDNVSNMNVSMTTKRKRIMKAQPDEIQSDLPLELRLMLQAEQKSNDIQNNSNGNGSNHIENCEPISKVPRISSVSNRGRGRGRGVRTSGNNHTITSTTINNEVIESKVNESIDNIYFSSDLRPKENTLWTIGWDQYFREERHQLCINIVKNRMESLAGHIVKIILDNSMSTELSYSVNQSSSMNVTKIYEQLKLDDSKINIDFSTLRKLLELMKSDAVGIVSKVMGTDNEDLGPSYYVNISSIINFYRRKTIHQIVVQKYGLYSGRIIELLQRKKYLDQQEISDFAIMPAREARERLYKLYRDNWVNYVEFSKRNDFNPSSTFYYWYLDHERSTKSLLDNMYKAILNLRIRRQHDLENYQNIEISEGLDLLSSGNNVSSSNAANTSIVNMTKSLDLIDSSILRLDKTIQLLHKF